MDTDLYEIMLQSIFTLLSTGPSGGLL